MKYLGLDVLGVLLQYPDQELDVLVDFAGDHVVVDVFVVQDAGTVVVYAHFLEFVELLVFFVPLESIVESREVWAVDGLVLAFEGDFGDVAVFGVELR